MKNKKQNVQLKPTDRNPLGVINFRDRRQHDIANFFLSVDLIAHINFYCYDAHFEA